jgi:hypothetical protein
MPFAKRLVEKAVRFATIAASHAINAQLALKAVTLISHSLELFLVPFNSVSL